MTNNERIQANNAELREAIEMAEGLPNAGGGVELPELTNPAAAEQIVQGYDAINAEGAVVTGSNPYEKTATDAEVNTQTNLIEQIKTVLQDKAVGGVELLFTSSGIMYVENLVVPETVTALSSGAYNINGIKSITALGVTSIGGHYCFGGAWNSLEVLICPRLTSWPGNYWCRGGNLKEVQAGSIGYPVTAMLNAKGFDLNSRADLVITIYVDATTLAEVPTDVSSYAPFGATKATIVYRNSTTGEVISE